MIFPTVNCITEFEFSSGTVRTRLPREIAFLSSTKIPKAMVPVKNRAKIIAKVIIPDFRFRIEHKIIKNKELKLITTVATKRRIIIRFSFSFSSKSFSKSTKLSSVTLFSIIS